MFTEWRQPLVYGVETTSCLRSGDNLLFTEWRQPLVYGVETTSCLRGRDNLLFTEWRQPLVYGVETTSCLRSGDDLLFGCCYRSPTKTISSHQNNQKLSQLIKCTSEKKNTATSVLLEISTTEALTGIPGRALFSVNGENHLLPKNGH